MTGSTPAIPSAPLEPSATAEDLRDLLEDVARRAVGDALSGRRSWRGDNRGPEPIFDLGAELARDPVGAGVGAILNFGLVSLHLATRTADTLRGETDRPLPPELRRTCFVRFLSAAGVRALGLTRDDVLAVARLRTIGGVGHRPTWGQFAAELAALIGTRPKYLVPVLEELGFELEAELPEAAKPTLEEMQGLRQGGVA